MLQFTWNMPLWLMSLYGGVMILLVLLIRGLFGKKLPKKLFAVLWALVFVRLLTPFAVSSPLTFRLPWVNSTLLSGPWGRTVEYAVTNMPVADTGALLESTAIATSNDFSHSFSGFSVPDFLPLLWTLGAAAVGLYLLVSYLRCRRKLSESYMIDQNELIDDTLLECDVHADVYTCDTVDSPLVLGIFRPVILLPTAMDFTDGTLLRHIITHEAMHIRRKDNLMKVIGLITLCLHWFNPLVWIMLRMLNQDLETACDEAVLSRLDHVGDTRDPRREYAGSLLAMATPRLGNGLFYSSFCKSEVERRIRGILGHRRAGRLALICSLLLVVCAVTAIASAQTPYDNSFSSFCGVDGSHFGAKVTLTRQLPLEDSLRTQSRADKVILRVLSDPQNNAPARIRQEVARALASEFGVESGAFQVDVRLCMKKEDIQEQYRVHGITQTGDSYYYQGKKIRYLEDPQLSLYSYYGSGSLDVYITRNEQGEITSVEPYENQMGDYYGLGSSF